MKMPRVVILGGGPAGVGGAYYLARAGRAQVTLVEQKDVVGGNAGSFEAFGQRLDYGSHRLHHATDPELLADLRALLGDDLIDRPRNGRIRLRGRWLRFPLSPLDLLLRLDPAFAFGAGRDTLLKPLRRSNGAADSFASVLLGSLGPTICHGFYFPYARKIWGRSPEELSGIQARRRVSAGSASKLVKRMLAPKEKRNFFYPRHGFGQISEAIAEAAAAKGADLLLGWKVSRIERAADGTWNVGIERNGEDRVLTTDHVWSTLPIPLAVRMMQPPPAADVLDATRRISYRAMVLAYVQLGVDRLGEVDAYYFPEETFTATRISEPKNYSGTPEPRGSTTLCAEIPCAVGDELWNASPEELGERLLSDLRRAGLEPPAKPQGVVVRKLPQAYPIYDRDYEAPFRVLDEWAESQPNFLTYGRQGLFAHDNTHHALAMAHAAAECLGPDGFDEGRWAQYREVFRTHVVED